MADIFMPNTELEYSENEINVKGGWGQISDAVRVTKHMIEKTSGGSNLENLAISGYLVPHLGESFIYYRARVLRAFLWTRTGQKLENLFSGMSVPIDFRLTQNDGKESIFEVNSVIRENKYKVVVHSTGDYLRRGISITDGIVELLEENSINYDTN